MRIRHIEEVFIGAEDGLCIRPKPEQTKDFSLVYRAGAGVRWLDSRSCFVASEPNRWEYSELFRHIIAVVEGEYGETLTLTENTKWLGVPGEVKQELQSCA